jgi:hypothetical protein
MRWAGKTSILAAEVCILLAILVSVPAAQGVEPQIPSSIDVYWKSTRAITVPGVSTVVVLDDDIAHAQIGNDTIEFAGLSRGQTVALAYINGVPVSIVVRVIDHPVKTVPPSLLQREAEMAHGSFGTDVQTSDSSAGSSYLIVDSMSWSQRVGDHRLDVISQMEDNSQFGGHTVNLRTGSVAYQTPGLSLNFVDFSQSLTGESGEDRINNFSTPSTAGLRGVDVTLQRGKDQFSFFAGTTIPYYFLSLNATRDVAGFSFHRKQTNRLNLFGSTTYLNIPMNLTNVVQRQSYMMQTAGASYRLTKGLLIGAQGGFSNSGGMIRADASYASYRFSGYGSAIFGSQSYPLNQIQSLFSGTSGFKAGLAYKTTSRLTQGLYYEHTNITPGLIYRFNGSSDYLSPNAGFVLGRGETLSFAYTYTRNTGGFSSGASTGNRYDVSLNSKLTAHLANTAQATIGSIQDPLQINSQDQFTVRDSVSVPIKGQTLLLSVEHDQVQPSLISKLNQEISLLSPALQTEFLANPAGFIDSSNFPPEIKALLAAEQPVGTTVSAGSTLSIGSKLRLTPNLSITRATDGPQANSWTESFGYSFIYQFRPTLQFHSSLSNILLLNGQTNSTVRTTLMTFGFQKNFSAAPGGLPFTHHSRIIEGRVFRDMNINGAYNAGEPGLPGIEVRLEDGQIATTDSEGRFKFSSVTADQHQVSIDLAQFRIPVRMTTRSEADADLIQQRIVVTNFGVLDFARVIGSVYNDLRFENHRQPDSKGIQTVMLLLDDGKIVRKIETGGSGEFEVDDIAPGNYKLSLDSASLPPNFTASADAVALHVSPVSTVVEDIPVRALRSIAGRVLLRMPSSPSQTAQLGSSHKTNVALPARGVQEKQKNALAPQSNDGGFVLIPLADVQIRANEAVVKTDQEGNFLIRNLPAGKVAISLLPVKPLVEGMKLPSGEVNLPADPIEVQGASIVISNPELVPYLTTQPLPNGPGVAPDKSAPLLQGRVLPGNPAKSSPKTSMLKEQPVPNQGPIVPPAVTSAKAVASLPSSSPAAIAPRTIGISELPSSTASSRLAQVAAAVPAAPMIAQTTPSAAIPKAIDCSTLPSLGETARCYKQLHNR